ncbi:MAG: hypothetical protein JW923_06950 [Spirochaetales bacterium]|nr:hypothetical protein [Spirochaetales bacterium]
MNRRTSFVPAGAVVLALLLAAAPLTACSSVFTASIQGTLIDTEAYDDGQTLGIADAIVYLYTDEDAWNGDYAAFVERNEATLPDAPGKASYRYFQSTQSGSDGSYQFTGFIWESMAPEYGKTADRRQIFILAYHPDYGLWKNATPIYVVSDVTARLPPIKMTDLWHEGRLSGNVADWKDGQEFTGAGVRIYVAESWEYDAGGNPVSILWPESPSATDTVNDGYWTADVSFPVMPSRAADLRKAPVRVVYALSGYRANDPVDGTDLDSVNDTSLGAGVLIRDQDLDRDGRTPTDPSSPDYDDAFVEALVFSSEDQPLTSLPGTVSLQRWQFSATVQGRVSDGLTPKTYLDGVEVSLAVPGSAEPELTTTATRTSGEVSYPGSFSFGTVSWELGDITVDLNSSGGIVDEQQSGRVDMVLLLDGAPPAQGDRNNLSPDVTFNLELVQ